MNTSFLGNLPEFKSSDENTVNVIAGLGARTVSDLGDILSFENKVHIQPILENIEYAKTMADQADALLKAGHIDQPDYDDIIKETTRYREVGQRTVEELNVLYPKLKQTLADVITSIGTSASTRPKIGFADAKKAAFAVKESASKALALAKADLAGLNTSVTSIDLLLKRTLGKVTQGLEEVRLLKERGATSAEIAEATIRLTNEQVVYQASLTNTNYIAKALDTASVDLDELVARSSQAIANADLTLESARVYEGGNAVSSGGVRLISNAIGAYTDPIKKLAFRLQRVSKLVTQGYEGFAKTLIEAGDTDAFIEEMNNLAGDKAAKETQAIRDQLSTIKDIMRGGGEEVTEEVMVECAKWMSPSWRLSASFSEDIVYFSNALNIGKFSDYFVLLGKGGYVIIQSVIKVPLIAAAAGLEALIGDLAATVVVDLSEAIFVGVSELTSAILAPEVMAVLYVFYGFIDAFKVHNFWEWINDMVSVVVTEGLTDKIYGLRILQYPMQSTIGDKDWHEDPASMLRIDSTQFKTTIDFWGKAYIDEVNKVQEQQDDYVPFEAYSSIMRIPGRYINPNNHPLDTQDEVDICIETDEYLGSGLLNDNTGKATGDGTIIPYVKGLVRNLVAFPVYQHSITWPDRNGRLVQTAGKFVEKAIDQNLQNIWKHWVTSGEWGPAFTHPTGTPDIRRAAAETNISDFNDFMNPSRHDKFAWTNVNTWLSNNTGKKALITHVMESDKYKEDLKTKTPDDMLWDLYIRDTQSTRTLWGYISKIRTLLLIETQQNVNVMSGVRKAKIWERWITSIKKTGIPLNTNRYNRLLFVGKLNQLVYSKTLSRSSEIEDEIVRTGGEILENILITTGSLAEVVTNVWAKTIERKSITSLTDIVDVPVFFGDMHCRIIVVQKPKVTCFVVFRGTTNAWEWVVDLDFTGAEYGEIVNGKTPGTFEMKLKTIEDGNAGIFESPDTFTLHRGFLRAWLAFKPEVTRRLLDIYKTYPVEDVIVTGHSLGAGITQIACLEIPSIPVGRGQTIVGFHNPVFYRRPHAYMYASPAVGDKRFAWHFANQTGESAHVYIDGDIFTMIPPILLPSKETWGESTRDSYFKDVVNITDSESGAGGVLWYLLSRVFKGMNIPYAPQAWRTNGSWDWKKILVNVTSINVSYMKHRAYHGGGLYLRLDDDLSGAFIEEAEDPGSTDSSIKTLAIGIRNYNIPFERHSIDNIVSTLSKVSLLHPDLFAEIDKSQNISWEDAATIARLEATPITIDVERILEQGTIVALGHTNKRYPPFQLIDIDDVEQESIISVDGMNGFLTKRVNRLKKRLKRKKTEGDYDGYL